MHIQEITCVISPNDLICIAFDGVAKWPQCKYSHTSKMTMLFNDLNRNRAQFIALTRGVFVYSSTPIQKSIFAQCLLLVNTL